MTGFDCGEAALNVWLQQRALANEAGHASRTYVVCSARRAIGYYCLSTGAVATASSPGRIRRNMPDPIPVIVLGRLAVDRQSQGHGLGAAMLLDAVGRTIAAAEIVGVRAMLVHAIDTGAESFYRTFGFQASPIDPLTLMSRIDDARRVVGHRNG